MKNNLVLLDLLERILGKGVRGNKGNYKFVCPFHISVPLGKHKLEINLETQQWKCWSCPSTNESKGGSIFQLFKKLKVNLNLIEELNSILPPKDNKYFKKTFLNDVNTSLELPFEYISLIDFIFEGNRRSIKNISANKALNYLKKRNINNEDIIKYNIGFCCEGRYENRIIIPSHNEFGNLNYFIARDFTDTHFNKYDNPKIPIKNIIPFELYINWDLPIILVEGIFDAICFKRNIIPLIGKIIPKDGALMKKLVESKVKKIYIALDKDAIKNSISICEDLIARGKEVYLVELSGKDFSEIGFEETLDILENTTPLTFEKLVMKKLELI